MIRLLAALMLISASLCLAADPDDSPEVKDHPDVPRFPGSVISSGNSHDFGSHDFPDGKGGNVTREGASWEISYAPPSGGKTPSPLELFRNYENAFKKKGGVTLYKQIDTGGGEAVLKMPLGGKAERWFHLAINNGGEQFTFFIIDDKAMVQQVEVSATEMAAALKRDGKIALRGILFDSGKDTIKAESEPLLAEITTMLKSEASLKISIDGHTDNQGETKSNLALSKRRAEQVKKSLVSKGIDAERLKTNGFGESKPMEPNTTEGGRAQNRRVELVKL